MDRKEELVLFGRFLGDSIFAALKESVEYFRLK